jgi:hypothetical protein
MDHVGGRVVYANSDPLNFGLVYEKTGGQAAAIAYTKNAETGLLERVDIADQTGTDTYYGLFTNADPSGVTHSKEVSLHKPQVEIRPRGGSRIDIQFNLQRAGEVRCELLTLSGRRAAEFFNGRMKKGSYTRSFRFDGGSFGVVANGVYVLKVSIDGVTVSRSRYLHQYSKAGGVR